MVLAPNFVSTQPKDDSVKMGTKTKGKRRLAPSPSRCLQDHVARTGHGLHVPRKFLVPFFDHPSWAVTCNGGRPMTLDPSVPVLKHNDACAFSPSRHPPPILLLVEGFLDIHFLQH